MDSFWERTLVDWVNCLKLQKPILKLDELRDGVFFANLQKVIKIPEEINTDILTCIFHIFKKYYPKLTIHEGMNVHLTDLKSEEINILTSMLMHYTCIYDRQDVLTSPLCHSLKPQTQTSIKMFLEKVQECPSLTNDDLMKIIQECTERIRELPNCLNFVASSAEDSKESPLYDIFKTPMSKRMKIFEKDKEILQLKASLEVAQEEKDDLEEDLRRQIERNKRLEKQSDQKIAEISRLKSEIVALENRTPPHFRDIDTVETERLLKTQIDSLEKIIERCNIENQELQDERDAERAKAKLLESQCKTWMEKYMDTEKKLQTLTEHSDEQESKLDNMKKHCEELEALLQEYKPKNSGEESFIEESFQLAPARKRRSDTYCTSYEDLAHSVVDLQLKEKEKENEEFRSALDNTRIKLEEAIKENRKCKNEIETLTIENGNLKIQFQEMLMEYNITCNKMEEANKTNNKFRAEIESLMMEINDLKSQKDTIQIKLDEYVQIYDDTYKKFEEATNENDSCRSEIETLKIKKEKLKEQVEQLLSENTDINNRNETMERELEAYIQTCGILEGNLEELKAEKEQLSEEKVQILQDLVDSVTQLKLIKIKLENVTEEKELVGIELQKAVCECSDLKRNIDEITKDNKNMQNTNRQLQEKIVLLESDIIQIKQYKHGLELKIEEIESMFIKRNESIEKMKQELKFLDSNNKKIAFENTELKTYKNEIHHTLTAFCSSYRKQLIYLKNEKASLFRETKSTFESISQVLQTLYKETGQLLLEKNEISMKLNVELEEKIEVFSNLETLKNYNNDLSKELDETNRTNFELKHQLQQLSCKHDALVVELEQTKSNILDYDKKNVQQSEHISSLMIEKEKLEGECVRLLKELSDVETELKHVSDDCFNLAEEKSSLEHNLSELKLRIDEQSSVIEAHMQKVSEISIEKGALEEEVCKTTLELKNTISQNKEETSKLEQAIVELKYELDGVVNEKVDLSNELDIMREEFIAASEKSKATCESLKYEINQLKVEKSQIITENEHLSRSLQELQQNLECLNTTNDEYLEKNRLLLAEKECLAHDLSEVTAIKDDLKLQFDCLQDELVKFEQKTIELTNSLDIKTDEHNRCEDERDILKAEVSQLQFNLQNVLSEQKELKDEIVRLNTKLVAQIEEYQVCYKNKEDLFKTLSEMSTQKNELEAEMGDIKEKINTLVNENQEIRDKYQNEIFELNNTLDAKNEEHQACLNEKQYLSQKLCELSLQKDHLGIKMGELKLELDNLNSEKQHVKDNLEREIDDLKSKLDTRDVEYRHIMEQKDHLADKVSVICSENNLLESELRALKLDLQNLLSESKENTKEFEKLQIKFKNELETLNAEKCSLSDELQTLKNAYSSKLQNCFAEKQFICKDVNILRNCYSNLVDEVKQFIGETKQIDVIKKIIPDILRKHTETCSNFHKTILKMQKDNEQLIIEKEQLFEELERANLQITDFSQEKDGLMKNNELLKLESLKLQQRLYDLGSELEFITSENAEIRKNNLANCELFSKQKNSLEEEIRTTSLENIELKKYKDKVTNDLKTYINLCRKYKQEIADLKIQHSQDVRQVNSALIEMTEVLRTLASKANNLEGDKKELMNKFNRVTQEKCKLESVVEEINCEHATLIHELESVISDKNIKMKEYENILDKKSNELRATDLKRQEVELKSSELNNKLQEAVKKITDLEDELERVTLQVSECKEIQDRSQQKKVNIMKNLEDMSIQKSRLNQELQEVIFGKEELRKKLETVIEEKNKEFAKLSEELESSVNHSFELKEEKQVLEKELQVYIDSCNNLVKQLEELKDEKQQLLIKNEVQSKEIQSLSDMAQLNNDQIKNITKENNEISEKLRAAESDKYDLLTSSKAVIAEKEDLANKLMYVSNKIQEMCYKLELTSNMPTNAENVEDLYCQNIFENLETISGKLDAILKERDVFDVVDKLSEEKADLIQTLENTMSDLRKTLLEKTNLAASLDNITKELEKLSVEKHNLCEELEMERRELAKVKKERNDILESQAAVLKETESSIRLAHESAIDIKNDLSRRIELLEKEKQNVKKNLEADLQRIREAYSKVVSTNSKMELEAVNLRRKIEEKNELLTDRTQIREAYERLLEENNKLMTEVDTLKYKRSRDREEFVNIVKKERTNAAEQENRKIREIKNEYEKKLEKMKERMLNLYKEEVNKEMQKVKDGNDESTFLQRTVEDLRQSLSEAEERVQLLETELEMFKIKEAQMQRVSFASRDSIRSAKDLQLDCLRPSGSLQSLGRDDKIMPAPNSTQMSRKVKSLATMQTVSDRVTKNIKERKITTLPRSRVDIEETVTVSRRTSIGVEQVGHNLEMEDEEDDFNNKYLADLKAGRCAITHASGSNANRLSELVWRNSLVPPHLKSSYPAETQFISPGHFKEDDIKTGNIELDDSLCKLLPGEKPRQKKDFGTTSYKKPGPPTPSKNGGRLSLQGNEVQPLRDHNERTPKKVTTPSRIKALFMGKTSSKENSESQNVTPGTSRRLSIFKKQKQ